MIAIRFSGARINGRDSWQFPQGGMHRDESPEQAMYRELEEEVGLRAEAVELLGRTQGWLHYRLPKRFIRHPRTRMCWAKTDLVLTAPDFEDSAVRLDAHDDPEFDHWRWVSYWYPVSAVVDFKQGGIPSGAVSIIRPSGAETTQCSPPAEKAVMLEVLRRLIQDVNDADSLEDALGLIVAQESGHANRCLYDLSA